MTVRFSPARGFTLLELVVVLGITGLIFAGLWGLLTSGSAQLQAQSAAQQYRQVIDATHRLLAPGVDVPGSSPANSFVVANYPLNVPTDLGLNILTDSTVGLLSPNFAQGAGANYTDAFGYSIHVKVEKLDANNQKWRFMVYSTPPAGGKAIADKVGAQVASLIGSEGGFIYTADTEGCLTGTAPATKACGSFNSFAINVADMSVAAGSGRIATLSFTNDNSLIGAPWLARLPYPSTDLNILQADTSFKLSGGFHLFMNGNTLDMGTSDADTTGGGALNINGGQFNMLGGTINMNTNGASSGGGNINMAAGNITNLGNITGNDTTFTFHNLTVNSSTSIDITTNSSVNVLSKDPNAVTLSINGVGRADIFQAGQFIYTSDIRLKENVHPIQNALQKVLQLHGMDYQWRSNHAKDVGLVAQDVEKVFPELVSHTDGLKGVDYAKMVAPLVEAIRQLKEENDALRAKVDTLETRVKN